MQRLTGVVRNYDWGDRKAIATILGRDPSGRPEAEYWLGAHPSAPSIVEGSGQPLDRLIAADTAGTIGSAWPRFETLPFLLKILAADRPLSIQAHPTVEQAMAGFAREDAAGIDRAAPERNYPDPNHKPELLCAITPFEAKCGFRPIGETLDLLAEFTGDAVTELRRRLAAPPQDTGSPAVGSQDGALAATVRWLLELPADRASAIAGDLTDQAAAIVADGGGAGRFEAEVAWTERIGRSFPGDVGVVVALLLNHVTLAPGQAMFLDAGNLHSYLAGVGVELMANSDNVLRCGLTSKHVDVAELLDVVDYGPGSPPVQTAAGPVHRFDAPVPEFSLVRLGQATGGGGADPSFVTWSSTPAGPSIVLVTAGAVEVVAADGSLAACSGQAVFASAGDGPFQVIDRDPGVTVAWVASVGSDEAGGTGAG